MDRVCLREGEGGGEGGGHTEGWVPAHRAAKAPERAGGEG